MTKHTAHIITRWAEPGPAQVIVFAIDEDTKVGTVVDRISIDADAPVDAVATLLRLVHGWTETGDRRAPAPGYTVMRVERNGMVGGGR